MNIELMKKVNILGIGIIASILVLLMVELLFAQVLTDLVIGYISNNLILFTIIMGMFILSMVISLIIGFYITETISQASVYKASIMSLLTSLFLIIIISNISLFISHKEVYSEIHGFEIILVFPQVIVYFGIYILNNVFNLFIFSIAIYYLCFVIFLDIFYEVKYHEKQ